MAIYFGSETSDKLDCYEEGTFSPNWRSNNGGSVSYTHNHGRYVKVGDVVTVSMHCQMSHSGTNGPWICTMPFTSENYSGNKQYSSFMTDNMNSGSSAAFWGVYLSQNSAIGYLYYITKNQGWTYQETGHDNNFGLIGQLTYEAV